MQGRGIETGDMRALLDYLCSIPNVNDPHLHGEGREGGERERGEMERERDRGGWKGDDGEGEERGEMGGEGGGEVGPLFCLVSLFMCRRRIFMMCWTCCCWL